jgi:hypothetical protein
VTDWREHYDRDDLAEQREQFGIEYNYDDRPVHPSGNPLTLGDGTPWPDNDEEENDDDA